MTTRARFPITQVRPCLCAHSVTHQDDSPVRVPKELPQKSSFRLDLQEHDHVYIGVAELPGIEQQHISIRFRDNGLLDISVERVESNIPESERYLIRERTSSSATRSLHLLHASGQGISAELQCGLLYVVVPKASYHWEPELDIIVR